MSDLSARHRCLARLAAVVVADAGALIALRPAASALPHRLTHLRRSVELAGVDSATAALAAAGIWLVAAWVALGLLGAVAGRLPGATGRAGRRAAALALPAALYRTVAAATGLGVLLSPVAATATAPGVPPPPVAVAAPDWPTSVIGTPSLPLQPGPPQPGRQGPVPTVRVHRGDSLWRIAAGRLPRGAGEARIAAAWPRWFAANRTVIGADPDRLVPGETLRIPKEFR